MITNPTKTTVHTDQHRARPAGPSRHPVPSSRSMDRGGAAVRWRGLVVAAAVLVVTNALVAVPAAQAQLRDRVSVTELATFVDEPCTDDICSSGSAVGPDGALYVTDATNGRIQRVDPANGAVTTFADGLPVAIAGVVGGGVADVAFRGRAAYVLVTGVSTFWTDLIQSPNVPATEGVYRLDRVGAGTTRATLVADLYTWSEQHPPSSPSFFIPGGFTYALETYQDGFLVTDGHHNRVLKVRPKGNVRAFVDFGRNIVPTGLETDGRSVLVGQAGPIPHTPDSGRVVAVRPAHGTVRTVATGAPLLVDIELTGRGALYGLAQGFWPYAGQEGKEGFPAAPHTGLLMRADRQGQFQTVAFHLDRPTTFELIGHTAYVVTITGKVLKVSGLR